MPTPNPFSSEDLSPRVPLLRRLTEIMDERCRLARALDPFYKASELLNQDQGPNYEALEANPDFYKLWRKDCDLRDEWIRLQLELA